MKTIQVKSKHGFPEIPKNYTGTAEYPDGTIEYWLGGIRADKEALRQFAWLFKDDIDQ